VEPSLARILLAFVYMDADPASMFDEKQPADAVMAREARRFNRVLAACLKKEAACLKKEEQPKAEEGGLPIGKALLRARRFHKAWCAEDVPKTLEYLLDSVVVLKAKQTKENLPHDPPEDTFELVRRLGGVAAETEARARYAGQWNAIAKEQAIDQIGKIAKRAFWDAIKARLADGDIGTLFPLLSELQQAMAALVAHSPKTKEELADKFDVPFIQQQAEHGCLELHEIHGLVRYLSETICSWQAAADDAEARAWSLAVEAALGASEGGGVEAYICGGLVDFLEGAHERLGRVYTRVLEMQEVEAERAAQAERTADQGATSELPWANPNPNPAN